MQILCYCNVATFLKFLKTPSNYKLLGKYVNFEVSNTFCMIPPTLERRSINDTIAEDLPCKEPQCARNCTCNDYPAKNTS